MTVPSTVSALHLPLFSSLLSPIIVVEYSTPLILVSPSGSVTEGLKVALNRMPASEKSSAQA